MQYGTCYTMDLRMRPQFQGLHSSRVIMNMGMNKQANEIIPESGMCFRENQIRKQDSHVRCGGTRMLR